MRKSVERHRRGRSRRRTYLYALSALVVVSALIYWEQTALLYVVSTLLVCGLLLTVAFADLEGKDRELFAAKEERTASPQRAEEFEAVEVPRGRNLSEPQISEVRR